MFRNLIIKAYIAYWLLVFRFKKISAGKNLRIRGPIRLQLGKASQLLVGDNFSLTSGLKQNTIGRNIISAIRVETNARIKIGNNVGISCSCLRANQSIEIGNNVKIGADCIIMDSNIHSLDYLQRREYNTDSKNAITKPIIIEEDVFIGTRSIITKGVTIGARSIIAAGSVVTKSIPSDEIWGGNPAKFIRKII